MNRTVIAPALISVTLFCIAGTTQSALPRPDVSDWPIRTGAEPQLFIDNSLIASQSGITLQLHPAKKYSDGPIIVPSPWEKTVLAYGSVLRDRQSHKLRMWYTDDIGMAYAESADGIHWEKPPVGMIIDGHPTNVLTRGHRGRSDTLTVSENPDRSDTGKRYLAYAYEYRYPDRRDVRETLREGIYLRTSPDGIHWTERPDPVMYSSWRADEDHPHGARAILSDVNEIRWDPVLRRFMGYVKISVDGVRMRGLTESDDGIYWSDPHIVLRADTQDQPGDQIYSMVAFPYGGAWLAFIGLYHKEFNDKLDVQLATSRDGRNWSRAIRTPFLTNGGNGAFDEGVIHMMSNPPLLINGELYIYYGGYGPTHSAKMQSRPNGIGLATLRPHGFMSADAGETGGIMLTRPLHFSGIALHINASVKPGGEIRIGVVDTRTGDEVAKSEPIRSDSVDTTVRWISGRKLGLHDARLRFELKDASLYAFWLD